MATARKAWPPTRDDLIVPTPSGHRPISQGDIFAKLPIVKANPPRDDGTPSRPSIDARPAMVLGYPCEMYDKEKLVPVQIVAVLRKWNDAGIPKDWFNRREPLFGAFGHCPLPNPLGDGELMAVDFRAVSNIDAGHLRSSERVASLTNYGTAYLRQRLGLYFGRVIIRLERLLEAGQTTFQEMALWEAWNEQGFDPPVFQRWLDEVDPGLAILRRDALEHGAYEDLRASILNRAA